VCKKCGERIGAGIYMPYMIEDDGSKRYLPHPGDCFTYSGLIKEFGKEEADRRYGHDTTFFDAEKNEIVNADPLKQDISKYMNLISALDERLIKCKKCGGDMTLGGFMVS
jgi:hypothetical protein